MMMDIVEENELFILKHLSESDDLSEFTVNQGKGLENYLKEYALSDEINNHARTYLVIYKGNNSIVAYFSLRTGLIPISRGFFKGFDTYTGIELANFAVNTNARNEIKEISRLGSYIFYTFIYSLVQEINKLVGAKYLYIYALPNDRLMEHYTTMGFSLFPKQAEKYIYRHSKPYYDKGCRFMYQIIN